MTELSERLGDFRRENLIDGNPPSVEAVECGQLARPETCDVPVNLGNRLISFLRMHVHQAYNSRQASASISKAPRLPLSKASRPAKAIMAALSVQ